MDEEYELVSKNFLGELKKENKKLLEENKKLREKSLKNVDVKDIDKMEIVEEKIISKNENNEVIDILKTEREEILKTLGEVRELNQRTLDNTLSRTEKIDQRLESMIDTMKELISNFSHVIEVIPNHEMKIQNVESVVEKKDINDNQIIILNKKLDDIVMFMNNLKILLSYIKPRDFDKE